MPATSRLAALALAAVAGGALLLPQAMASDAALSAAVEARQGQFKLLAFNLGGVGAMAQGAIPYDAEAAQAAADNLARLASLHQAPMWPMGSDSASIEGTRALPAIWERPDAFAANFAQLGERTAALAAVASDGLDAIRAGLGPVAQTCSACHQDFRAPR